MRLYYIAAAEGHRRHIRSALGVNAERWNDVFREVRDWRLRLRNRYGIATTFELHALGLLAPRQSPGDGSVGSVCTSLEVGAEVLRSGLRLIEDAAHSGGVEVINVCLPTTGRGRHGEVSLGRLLTRINTSVATGGRHAFLLFDEAEEESVTRLYRRLRVHNPIPSRYEAWDDGSPTRNIPLDRIIGGLSFRSAGDDHLLQLAGFVAHALLLQEEGPSAGTEELGVGGAFAAFDHALNREASARDPQGVVRR